MRRFSVLFASIFALAFVAGCPPGGGNDSGVTGDASTMDSSSGGGPCQRQMAALMVCGRRQCEIDDALRNCNAIASHTRAEANTVVAGCVGPAPTTCPDAGTGPTAETTCITNGINALAPTAAHTNAAMALCAACPFLGGAGSTTAAQCNMNIFAIPDGGTAGLGQLIRQANDASAMAMTTCAMPLTAGTSCGPAAQCVIDALGITPTTCTAPDAGTTDSGSMGDAGGVTCLHATEACANSGECCGPGLCTGGTCDSTSCLSAGRACTRSSECCGGSPCTGGMCAGADAGMTPDPGRGGAIVLGATTRGVLSTADTFTPPGSGTPIIADVWTVTLAPGMYTLRMCATPPFDPSVFVYQGTMLLGMNDDAIALNSRLVFTVATAGAVTIAASSYMNRYSDGAYAIRIDTGAMPAASCPLP